MVKSAGLLGKFTRAFLLQVGFITLAAILGVYLATIVIDETLVKSAMLEEADYFWKHYHGDREFHLPDTSNLTGYFDAGLLPPVIQDNLPFEPGFYEFADLSNQLVLYISSQQGQTLYLVFYRGQVDALVLYYGLFPLIVVLIILYLTLWFAYRFSRRTISPITQLAHHINEIDLNTEDLSLKLEGSEIGSDDEIQILTDAISQLGARLNAFVARERNFTRDASHEFRSPLTVINVATDMMLIDDSLPPKTQKSLLKIKRAVYDLENLTEVFLMLAREHGGSLSRQEVNVNQVVLEQIERAEFLRENKDIRFELNETGQLNVYSSETVIGVLLGNLVRNALLYTEQGEVRIDIGSDQVTITDSGPGIPASKIDGIFEPFERANRDNTSGYGIGLAIVKRLCDRFGWRVDVDSAADQGTSFRLVFAQN